MRRIVCVGVVVWLLAVVSAQAQTTVCTSACTAQRGEAFTVAADWATTTAEPDPATGFRLYQNGVVVRDVEASSLVNGTIAFSFPQGLSASGVYTFAVAAYNTAGEGAPNPTITLTVQLGKPAPTKNPRLTKP